MRPTKRRVRAGGVAVDGGVAVAVGVAVEWNVSSSLELELETPTDGGSRVPRGAMKQLVKPSALFHSTSCSVVQWMATALFRSLF